MKKRSTDGVNEGDRMNDGDIMIDREIANKVRESDLMKRFILILLILTNNHIPLSLIPFLLVLVYDHSALRCIHNSPSECHYGFLYCSRPASTIEHTVNCACVNELLMGIYYANDV